MNKAMLIGYVGKEPEVRYFEANECTATFPLATTERGYTLPNGTVVPDRTDWHTIVLFKSLAKYAEKYIHKGDKVYIEGRIRYRSYDDKKGMRRMQTEIYADNLEWLSASKKTLSADGGASLASGNAADGEGTEDNSKLPF